VHSGCIARFRNVLGDRELRTLKDIFLKFGGGCHTRSVLDAYHYLPHILLAHMVTTRSRNANVHPGQILLDNKQARRSTKQVKEARCHAKAAKVQEEARCLAVPGHIAQLEDKIETEEQAQCEHSIRPDLHGAQPTDLALQG